MTQMDSPTSPVSAMRDPHIARLRPVSGLRLRELLVLILLRHAAPMTVAALVAAVHARGFRIEGRPGKVVSDHLRYELARDRVRRAGRGLYIAGTVTRQARWRMQRRITALHSAAASGACSTTDDTRTTDDILSL